jgi:hypothetical protein
MLMIMCRGFKLAAEWVIHTVGPNIGDDLTVQKERHLQLAFE